MDSAGQEGQGGGRAEGRGHGSSGDDKLESRIDTLMGEFRMLTPGIAALFGFQLTVAFQQTFKDLSTLEKALNFLALATSALAFLLLLVPAHHHRFIHRLREDEEFLRFAKRFIGAGSAVVPFTFAFTLALQAMRTFGSEAAGAAAFAATLFVFLVGWWLYPVGHARRRNGHGRTDERTERPAGRR